MIASNKELMALLLMKRVLRKGAEPQLPQFLEWIAARLVEVHHDDPAVDYVQALHRYAGELVEIQEMLDE